MMNGFDAARARDALFALDAGCSRDEWVPAGMAAKAAGLSEDDFLEWSATGANYGGERDACSVWKSIKPDGGVRAGTLFKMATDVGWRDSHARNVKPAARVTVAKPTKAATLGRPRTDLAATFDGYAPASADHRYIVAKRGNPDGLRVVPANDTLTIGGQRVAGWLAVPVRSFDGMLCAVQFIPPRGAGNKLNAPGASFDDGLFVVGDIATDASRTMMSDAIPARSRSPTRSCRPSYARNPAVWLPSVDSEGEPGYSIARYHSLIMEG